ncbi:phosphopantetheine-binding protein [Nonomuraea sp. NPDC002799]
MSDTVAGGVDARRPDDDVLVEQVARIWGEVLRVDGLTADDPLPDLGAQSIRVIEIALRIQRELGADLPLEVFVLSETIRDLAQTIADTRREQAAP